MIRQSIDYTRLVIYAYDKSSATRVAKRHHLASDVIFICNTFLELYLTVFCQVTHL